MKTEPNVRTGTLADLKFDEKNANQGTEEGTELIRESIQQHGVGRGIVVASDGTIIGGNHVTQLLRELEDEDVEVVFVQTTGKTLVVTERTDIDSKSKEFHELAVIDNRSNEKNLRWNHEQLASLAKEFEIDLTEWGFHDPEQVSTINEQDEWDQMQMPSFEAGKDSIKLQIAFENEADRDRFLLEVGLTVSKKGAKLWSTWWPEKTTGFQSTQIKYEEQAAVSDLRDQQGEV